MSRVFFMFGPIGRYRVDRVLQAFLQGRECHLSMHGTCGQCLDRVVNSGLLVHRKAVWSMQGRAVSAGQCVRCRAVRSVQGRAVNAGPCGQCRRRGVNVSLFQAQVLEVMKFIPQELSSKRIVEESGDSVGDIIKMLPLMRVQHHTRNVRE